MAHLCVQLYSDQCTACVRGSLFASEWLIFVLGYIQISVQHVLEAVCELVSGSSLCSVIFRSVYSMF